MNLDRVKNIGIIMGGYSNEYDISIKSGQVVYETLKDYYNCYRLYIKKNEWILLILLLLITTEILIRRTSAKK